MRSLRNLCLLLLVVTLPAAAEQTYTAGKIVFNHPGSYTQTQLEAVAEIHTGTKFTATTLGDAAQRLVDTGFFADVGAKLNGRVEAITVLFDIKPLDRSQMLPLGFENFVWLSHAEIESALQAKSSLFQGYLPETSPTLDVFNAALIEALATKGITAKVMHETIEPTMTRPQRCIEFRITVPYIRVGNIKLSGVSTLLAPLIQT